MSKHCIPAHNFLYWIHGNQIIKDVGSLNIFILK